VWVALKTARRVPLLSFALAWYFLFTLLTCGVFQSGGQQTADRYMYIPSILPCLGLVHLGFRVCTPKSRWVIAAAVCLLTIEGKSIRTLIPTWNDDLTLFCNCLKRGYENAVIDTNIAAAEVRHKDYDAAKSFFVKALSMPPAHYLPYLDMGILLLQKNEPRKSLILLTEAAKLDRRNARIYGFLGEAYVRSGRLREGAAAYKSAIAEDPNAVKMLIDLSLLLSSSSEPDLAAPEEGLVYARRAVRLTEMNNADALIAYAAALAANRNFRGALASINHALDIAQQQHRSSTELEVNGLRSLYGAGVFLRTNMPLRLVTRPNSG